MTYVESLDQMCKTYVQPLHFLWYDMTYLSNWHFDWSVNRKINEGHLSKANPLSLSEAVAKRPI